VELAAFRAKPRALLRRLPEIEIAAIAVVEENAVSDAMLQADVERNRLVDRIFAFGVAGRGGIPVDERAATFVDPLRFLAQAVEVFVKIDLLRSGDEHSRFRIEH